MSPDQRPKSPRKPPSEAITSLCESVNREGRRRYPHTWKPVTPRKIERWSQDELVDAPRRPGRGQGGGRAAIYTDDHVDQTVEVAELMRQHGSRDLVAAVLFVRGRSLSEARLRAAFTGALDRLEQDIATAQQRGLEHAKAAGEVPEVDRDWTAQEAAEWAEPTLADRLARSASTAALREGLKDDFGARTGLQALAFEAASTFFEARADLPTLAVGLGLLEGDELASSRRADFLSAATRDVLGEVVRRADLTQFERARELAAKQVQLYSGGSLEPSFGGGVPDTAFSVIAGLDTELGRVLLVLLPLALEIHFSVPMDVWGSGLDQAMGHTS